MWHSSCLYREMKPRTHETRREREVSAGTRFRETPREVRCSHNQGAPPYSNKEHHHTPKEMPVAVPSVCVAVQPPRA